jgi:hypothetical protein
MKKVLVLAFVLGLSSLANAAWITQLTWSTHSINVGVDETVTVQLIATSNQLINGHEPAYDGKWVGNDPSPVAEIVGVTEIDNNAGNNQTLIDDAIYGYPGWWTVGAVDLIEPFDTITSGAQWNVTIKGLSAGTYVIGSDYYEQGGPGSNDLLTIIVPELETIVPEPATIALLCLGGLMLRRRK